MKAEIYILDCDSRLTALSVSLTEKLLRHANRNNCYFKFANSNKHFSYFLIKLVEFSDRTLDNSESINEVLEVGKK